MHLFILFYLHTYIHTYASTQTNIQQYNTYCTYIHTYIHTLLHYHVCVSVGKLPRLSFSAQFLLYTIDVGIDNVNEDGGMYVCM